MQIQRFFQNPLNDFNQMKISIGELLNLSNEYEISFDLFYKINGLKYNIQRI